MTLPLLSLALSCLAAVCLLLSLRVQKKAYQPQRELTWQDGDLLDDSGRALAHVGPWGDGVRWAWWVFGRALSENLHGGCESREEAVEAVMGILEVV